MSNLIRLANSSIASLHPYQPGKSEKELQRELGISNIIKLASNENPLGPGNRVEGILSSLPNLARYPDGDGYDLKLLLAEHHSVEPSQITLGNGSNEIFEFIARAIAGESHEIIFSEYAFALYALVTQAVGARPVVIPAKDWQHDISAMQAAINKNTRIMFIANPNNPTGTWLNARDLRTLLDSMPPHMLVVVDEAYAEYVQARDYPDCTQWVKDYPQLLVTRTFSKIYGLAGLRVGYGISDSSVAELMNRVRQPFNVNTVALSAAMTALADKEHLQESIQSNMSGMQQLTAAFDRLGLKYIPSAGNFIAFEVGQNSMGIYRKLLSRGIIVRPLNSYKMPNHLRVTVGLWEENERFLSALENAISVSD